MSRAKVISGLGVLFVVLLVVATWFALPQPSAESTAATASDRVTRWHGMLLRAPTCFELQVQEYDVHVRSDGTCSSMALRDTTPWLAVLFRPGAAQVEPFDSWRPCRDYDECRTFRKREGDLRLECYEAKRHDSSLLREGCRAVEHRIAIRYFCFPEFCPQLRGVATEAFRSLEPKTVRTEVPG